MPMEKTFDAADGRGPDLRGLGRGRGLRAPAPMRNPAPKPSPSCIPPPNVTGSLHMGHAFNNTLQDILIRWHRMRGFDTLWQPGTDHAGIATQMVVERELANAAATSAAARWAARPSSPRSGSGRRNPAAPSSDSSALGAPATGPRGLRPCPAQPASPMDAEATSTTRCIKVFVDFYNKGLIYRGKRLVNWDPHFETAISDLEVEKIEVQGHMWHFKYPLAGGATYEYVERDADGTVTLRETRDYIVHRHHPARDHAGRRRGRGASRRTRAMRPSSASSANPRRAEGSPPLIPIITDDYPDPAFGSGAVKITGAHDFNDYAVAKRNGIPCYRLMDMHGHACAPTVALCERRKRCAQISPARAASTPRRPIEPRPRRPARARPLRGPQARRRAIAAEGLPSPSGVWPRPAPNPDGPLSRRSRSRSPSATAPRW